MQKITALKQQQRNKQRISIFLDGEFAFGLPDVVASDLRVDQLLSEAQIDDLQGRATLKVAELSAERYISYRPRSSAEVERNLVKKGYEPTTIEIVIERLQASKLIDDWEFARFWIEQRETFRPRSRIALAMELRQKGVESEVVDDLLREIDENASARRAAEKRLGRWEHLPEDEFRTKLYRYLNGRGFGYGIAREVADSLLSEQAEND